MTLQLSPRFAAILAVACLMGMVPRLEAHGGGYRGPYVASPPSLTPPTAPAGTGGGPALPPGVPRGTTGGADLRRWETWWGYNREEFFPARGTLRPMSGIESDGYAPGGPKPPASALIREKVLPLVIDLLRHGKDVQLRDSAAIALGKIGDVREFKELEAALKDSERTVVEAAISALGLLRCDQAEQKLIEIAKDATRSARERGFAVVALGYSGLDLAKEFLFKGLGIPGSVLSDRARAADLETLRVFAASLVGESDLKKAGTRPEADPATGYILKALGTDLCKEQHFFSVALAALAKVRDPSAEKALLNALGSSKSDLRAGAAISIGRILHEPEVRTMRLLLQALDAEGDLYPRRMLLISLGRMGGEPAVKALKEWLYKKDRQDRSFAALALALAGERDLLPLFRQELKDAKDSSLSGAFAIGLGILGDTESVPLIIETLARRKDPEFQAHLIEALILLKDRGAVPAIEKLLAETRSPNLQAVAALALGLIAPESSTPVLLRLLKDAGTIGVKGAAATALGRAGDERMVEPLVTFARNESEQPLSRAFAIVALGIIGEKAPRLPPFSRCSIDSNYEVRIAVLDELRDLL